MTLVPWLWCLYWSLMTLPCDCCAFFLSIPILVCSKCSVVSFVLFSTPLLALAICSGRGGPPFGSGDLRWPGQVPVLRFPPSFGTGSLLWPGWAPFGSGDLRWPGRVRLSPSFLLECGEHCQSIELGVWLAFCVVLIFFCF